MNRPDGFKKQLLLLLLIVAGALVVVFDLPAFMPDGNHASQPLLNPSQMLFNNDNPLGWHKAEYNKLPGTIFGVWANLYWIGTEVIGDSPRLTSLAAAILHPILFVKYYPAISLIFLGFCAWLYFRQLKFNPAVCLFGGLAVALNMHFFSCATWGVFLWNISA
ncbi:MAG: hypothetical protein JWO95_1811, partial [Verrucomicrobiales bacterium]|nr:hypothetical protein [Verrucomicrobiales bacterium]